MKCYMLATLLILCMHAFAQNQYLVHDRFGNLYAFDPDSCTTTVLGFPVGVYDIAICPNGQIYSNNASFIYHLDPLTQQNIQLSPTPFAGTINALLALSNDYLLTYSETNLYRVSTLDGSFITIGSMPGSTSAGDFIYLNGYFYLPSETNELWRFRLSADYSMLLEYGIVGTLDTPYQRIYGLMKTGNVLMGSTDVCHPSETKDTQRIIGFEDRNAYEIDVTTGHCSLLCENLLPDSIFGAASQVIADTIFDSSGDNSITTGASIELPNIFTPNNDGINDFFYPTSFQEPESFELTILNRWGNLVYSSANSTSGWDGTTDSGEPANEGVYFYHCRYTQRCPFAEGEQNGYLELIR